MSNLADEIKGTVTAVMNSSYQSYMNIYHRKYTYVHRHSFLIKNISIITRLVVYLCSLYAKAMAYFVKAIIDLQSL